MYVWIWRHIPGGVAGKIVGSLLLLAAAVLILFMVVFPWVSPKLPFNHVTVDTITPSPTVTQTTPAVPN